MNKLLFLNIGWMSKYQGLTGDTIRGGGAYVSEHGFGHELMNFQAFKGRMYGFAQVPKSSIKIEKLGASTGASSVHGVLVIWVASSRIVGWYKNATIFRNVQQPPVNSGRIHKGHPIGYNVTAAVSDCKLLDPDARLFPIPRAQRRSGGMGRYSWYAEGAENERIRKDVLAYVLANGNLPFKQKKHNPAIHAFQPDIFKREKVEKAAIEMAAKHFEDLGYLVDSVETDNLGWDLNAEHQATSDSLCIEVKGLSGPIISVEMTRQEYEMMRKHRKRYRICIVTQALEDKARALHVFAYVPALDKWLDGKDRSIQIKEVTSARLRCN